jgi:hypothetical protein
VSRAPVKTILFIVLAVVILGGGLAGAMIALHRARRMSSQFRPAPVTNSIVAANPFAAQEFSASPVKIETAAGTKVTRAIGSVKNLSTKRRFGVHVEIELKDEAGKVLDPAKDYTPTLEPGAEWRFNALVLPKSATSGRVTTITEDK